MSRKRKAPQEFETPIMDSHNVGLGEVFLGLTVGLGLLALKAGVQSPTLLLQKKGLQLSSSRAKCYFTITLLYMYREFLAFQHHACAKLLVQGGRHGRSWE